MILIHKKEGKYINLDDFIENASNEEIIGLLKGINKTAKKLGISVNNGKGYRALINIGTTEVRGPTFTFSFIWR